MQAGDDGLGKMIIFRVRQGVKVEVEHVLV